MELSCKNCKYWELTAELAGTGTCKYFLWVIDERGFDSGFNDAPFWAKGISKYTIYTEGAFCRVYEKK